MADRLLDLARRVDDESVRSAFRIAYSGLSEYAIGREIDALRSLRLKEPSDPEGFTIRLRRVEDEGESWIDVDAVKVDDPQAYSLSASPWALWAALPFRLVDVDMTEAQIMAHVLWEMTFHGDEEQTKEFFDDLREQIDNLDLGDDEGGSHG